MSEQALRRDEQELREELVQVAAVCVAWIEQLDLGGMDADYSNQTGHQRTTLNEIRAERQRQDELWGPGRTLPPLRALAVLAEEVGEVAGWVEWHPDPHSEYNQVKRSLQDGEYWARRAL